ncbi:MAG: NADP-dependent oxidoreductase [Candidatus Aenigmarchaeota archaeon]|nr:NADP-dependent oxidoreductase [Candidatus Aenigmarchaeota archaeon]
MRAAQINKYGSKEVVEIDKNATKPALSAGHAIIEARAAGVNPVDWKIREGYLQQMMPLKFPATLGGDFSGVVADIGAGVSGFKKGDEVYGLASVLAGGSGSFADYISADAALIAHKPKNASHTEAAALPLAGISAWDVLVNKMELSKGQKILIHGGAGGIGSIAIQLAKHAGAYVATTVSADDRQYVTGLGADEVIDYKSESFEGLLHGYDAVFDTVGGEVYKKSFSVLKKGGIIVSMLEQPDEELTKKYGVRAMAEATGYAINTHNLSALAALVDRGVIKVHVDRVFLLEHAAEALAHQQSGHPRGKIVLEVKR